MKKLLIYLLSLIIILPLILIVFVEAIAESAVESYGSRILKSDVSVESISISLFSGSLEVENLKVANPEGFSKNDAFSLGKIEVILDRGSLLSDTIIIEEIDIIQPMVTYEAGTRGININTLRGNASETGSVSTPADKETTSSSDTGKNVVVSNLYIKDGKIKFATNVASGAGIALALPDIHLQDIGKKEGGIGFSELVIRTLQAIITNLPSAPKALINSAAENVKNLKDSVEGVTKGVGGMLENILGK